MAVLVSLENVSKNYEIEDDADIVALFDVSLEIRDKEFISLIGPSGCGKSTTLNIIAGLLEPSTGDVRIADHPPARARKAREIGVVFQDSVLLPWRTTRDNAAFLLEIAGKLNDETWRRVDAALAMVGLSEFSDRYPHQLSGGMKQRVSIARALSLDPLLLLMDEPFGALDEFTRQRMNSELLNVWSQTQKTVIFVTHNIAEAVYLSDRVIAMSPRPGRIVEDLEISLERPRVREVRYTQEFNEYVVHLQRLLESEEP